MNPFDQEPSERSGRTGFWVVGAQAVFALSSLVTLFLSLSDRIYISTSFEIALAVIGGIATYALGVYIVIRRFRQVRRYKFRLAVTGLPKAGKTVFSIVTFDTLMNGRVAGVSFSAESRALISVYQAIRNLPAGKWPKSTKTGNVSVYEGEISLRRTKISLEIGDSAGEYWLEFNDEEERDQEYLEYVLSAQGIAHVIPLDELGGPSREARLERDIEDLRLASRLKRSAVGQSPEIPLLIVLSQADKVFPIDSLMRPESGLLHIFEDNQFGFPGTLGRPHEEFDLEGCVGSLRSTVRQLEPSFSSVHLTISSGPAIAQGRLHVGDRGDDLIYWIIEQARRRTRSRSVLDSVIGRN